MLISGSEPSSVILSQTMSWKVITQKVPKQAEAKQYFLD